MGILITNIILTYNIKKRKIYKICFDNKKFTISLKYININKAFILLMLILISINIFIKWANNNLNDNTLIIIFKTKYIND